MSTQLTGSKLAHSMLKRGKEEVWCAVSNHSDEHAMTTIDDVNHSFLKYIISSEDGFFFCKEGSSWQYAVPIKKTALTQNEVGL